MSWFRRKTIQKQLRQDLPLTNHLPATALLERISEVIARGVKGESQEERLRHLREEVESRPDFPRLFAREHGWSSPPFLAALRRLCA